MKFLKKNKQKLLNNIWCISGLICFFFLVTTLEIKAQTPFHYMDELKTKDFDEVVKLTEEFFENREKGKGTGYKQFKRWESMHKNRINSEGEVINFSSYNREQRLISSNRLVPNTSSWQPVAAPKYSNMAGQQDFAYNGGLGRINCIAIHPSNDNIIYVGTPASGIWKTTSGGANWSNGDNPDWMPLMEDQSIGVSGIVIDPVSPQNIYVLTGDGDGGQTCSVGVLKSTDGGNTWNPTNLQWDFKHDREYGCIMPYKLARHNSGSIFAVTSEGIYKSDSNGNWSIIPNKVANGWFYDIEFHPDLDHIIYASTYEGIYRSLNSGESFTLVPGTDKENITRIELAVSEDEQSYVYAVYGGYYETDGEGAGIFKGVYRSTNHGGSFQLMSDSPNILGYLPNDENNQAWYDLSIAVNPADASEIHIGGINMWRSLDGGATWEMTSYWVEPKVSTGEYTHADIHSLIFHNNVLYCGSDGGIYKSNISNGEANSHVKNLYGVLVNFEEIGWQNISYGLDITQVYRIGTNKNPESGGISYGAQDNGINLAYYDNASGDWNQWIHWHGADGVETFFDPFDDNIIYGSEQYNTLYRYNMATGTQDKLWPDVDSLIGNFAGAIDLNINSGAIIVAYEDIYRIEKPRTGTRSDYVNLTSGKIPQTYEYVSVASAPSNPDVIFASKSTGVSGEVKLFMTQDGGDTWTNYNFYGDGTYATYLTNNLAQYITFHPTDHRIAWVCVSGHTNTDGRRIFNTIDGGSSWHDISLNNGLENVPVNCIEYQNGSDNTLYIGTDIGVFYIENGLYKEDASGNPDIGNWIPFNNNLPAVIINDLEINYCTDVIYAGTFGRGVWESPLATSSFSPDLTLTNIHPDSNIFLSDTYINSTADAVDEVNVVYQAGTSVCLLPGFISMPDDENFFCGQIIDPCNVTVPFTANRVLNEIVESMDGEEFEEEGGIRISEEIFKDTNLKILGNPSPGETAVSFDLETLSKVSLHIYDQQGKLVKQILENVNLNEGNHQYDLHMSDHQKGVYFIALSYNDKKSIKKLVKL